MIKKKNFNQPFCMSIIAMVFLLLGIATKIGMLIVHVINNHLALFSQTNSSYTSGWTDVSSTCSSATTRSSLAYYCLKYSYHLQYLMIENVAIVISIVLMLTVLGFYIVFTINVKKKAHNCMTQIKVKQTALGFYSFGMIFALTQTAYILSFYLDMSDLNSYSSNISDYRNTFFIGVIVTTVGSALLFVGYVITFTIKIQKAPKNNTEKAANGLNQTINYTVGETGREEETKNLLKEKKKIKNNNTQEQMPIKDFRDHYKNQKKNQKPPKAPIVIEEVEQHEEVVLEENQNDRKIYGGIVRARPALPTTEQVRNTYPKRQRPRIIKPAKKISNQAMNILNQIKFDSINKVQQGGQIQVVNSMIHEEEGEQQNEEGREKQNDKENNMESSNIEILNTNPNDVEVEMVSLTKNTEGQSAVDPTHLHIFKRNMDVSKYLKLRQRWN